MLMEFLQQLTGGELKYKLPEQEIPHRFRTQIGGQTIGEALEQICNEAGVRYRVDDKGVVVIESTPQLTGGNIQKIYWLKPDAFPPGASAQDLLVAKGRAVSGRHRRDLAAARAATHGHEHRGQSAQARRRARDGFRRERSARRRTGCS